MSVLLAATPSDTKTGGLLFACWAIVIVLAAMFVTFMKARKKAYALAVLPLILLPLLHIFSGLLAKLLGAFLPLDFLDLRNAIDMTGGLVSCLLTGLAARGIPGKRSRLIFTISCTVFLVILTLALIFNHPVVIA